MKVAIIGRAWRTPLGSTLGDVMGRLLAGERAAIVNPQAAAYACVLAAPIHGEPGRSRDARFLRRMGLYGLEVAREALRASGVEAGPRVGLFSGVGGLRAHWDDMLPALANQRDDGEGAWERGLRDVHPYWMLRHLSNNVHALAAAELGLRGEGATFGGSTGGAQAIAAAARALHDGAIDAALVVAYDSLLEPETLVELGARGAATGAGLGELAAPYSPGANGYVPGEAAAAIVLVRPEDRPADATQVFLEALDTGDGAAAEPDAATLQRLLATLQPNREHSQPHLSLALGDFDEHEASQRITAAIVDGAARAHPELDRAERAAIAAALSPAVALTAFGAAMGQLGAATSVVQAIALVEILQRGVVPPISGLTAAADGPCLVVEHATPTTSTVAYGLSTGAPGLAAAIRVELHRTAGSRLLAEVA